MKLVHVALIAAVVLVALVVGYAVYMIWVANPRVAMELVEDPHGERAQKVMLITLPSGRRLPVNYLREGDRVYAGADGSWWKELVGEGVPVTLLVRGETLSGRARAVRDDPDQRKQIFARLRPNAIEGFGTLVEIRLDAGGGDSPSS